MRRFTVTLMIAMLGATAAAQEAPVRIRNDSISIRIVNTELRAAVQMLGAFLDRPVLFSGGTGITVTLETPTPIPRADVRRLLRGLIEAHGHEFVDDTVAGMYRVRPREAVRTSPSLGAPRLTLAVELHVIALQHARATDVASTINALYGRSGGGGEGGVRSSSLAEELRGNLMPPAGASVNGPAPAQNARSGSLSGELTVVADTRANALLVRANAADVALIRAVVEALDVRPLQVLIEVTIAEVRRDRTLGIQLDGALAPTSVGRSGASIEGALGEAGLGDFALRVMGLGGYDLNATLRLAAARGTARILTRPVLLATNNETAEITVGSQRPFVQVQRSLPTDGATRDQVVQYRDVGTKLSVRPTISADGSVQLEVSQEVSTATSEVAFNAPVISSRTLRTQLLVRDGQTVVLGGLTDQVRETRQSGLPFLSSIPLLGGLFGKASRGTVETELFIFLTPRVIRSDDDAVRLTTPLRTRADPP